MLAHFQKLATEQGDFWQLAILLSNVQAMVLNTTPPLLDIQDTRNLQEAFIKGPDHGVPELKKLSERIPRGRVFIWAPGDANQTTRILSSYETAAAMGLFIPDVSMLTL